jgi:hypothetical protein
LNLQAETSILPSPQELPHHRELKISKADATKFFATPAYSKDIQNLKSYFDL